MDEMRGGASTLHRGLADRDAQPDHPATSWCSIRYVDSYLAGKRFPHFGENALTMGRKSSMPMPCGDRWMELTEEDVLEILKLFEQSKFDFLQLEQGERRITVSKGGYVPTAAGGTRAATSSSSSVASAGAAATNAAASAPQPEAKPATSSIPAGLVAVTAPMVGKFYSAAAPSDPPYVEVGSKVVAGATVGLIEVMKVFASIKTETAGVIERILVSSGEFVEFGQPLFLLRPN
jgi:acetyl-CoA carboxylase biotin carboxyl carrier protein